MPTNLGPGPTSFEDFRFFNDERVDEIIKRVTVLEKAKVETKGKLKATKAELKETKEKLKSVEAENVVLKNELTVMNEKVLDIEARTNVSNEMFDEILSTNCDLNDANTMISHANEILQEEIEDLKVKDENKTKQIEMLYVVIEDRLGINVHAAYDDIGIRRLDEEEVPRAAKVKGKSIAEEEFLGSSSQQE
ncbi:hypothetical protein Hanom_Chr02g00114491 [Helianthus anomalus]